MPRAGKATQDPNLLSAALEGLELQRQRIDEQIAQVRAMLGGRKPAKAAPAAAAPNTEKPARRQLSAAARKRIAMAQKRRWAEYRKTAGKEEK